jgi:hypothetical protein
MVSDAHVPCSTLLHCKLVFLQYYYHTLHFEMVVCKTARLQHDSPQKNRFIGMVQRPDEPSDENCVVAKFNQSSICVMVWGCIAWGRKGPLVVLEYPGGKEGE